MNTTLNNQRLSVLAQRIERLDAELVEAERDAGDILGDELACALVQERVILAKIAREAALVAYFIEAEVVRRGEQRAA